MVEKYEMTTRFKSHMQFFLFECLSVSDRLYLLYRLTVLVHTPICSMSNPGMGDCHRRLQSEIAIGDLLEWDGRHKFDDARLAEWALLFSIVQR